MGLEMGGELGPDWQAKGSTDSGYGYAYLYNVNVELEFMIVWFLEVCLAEMKAEEMNGIIIRDG